MEVDGAAQAKLKDRGKYLHLSDLRDPQAPKITLQLLECDLSSSRYDPSSGIYIVATFFQTPSPPDSSAPVQISLLIGYTSHSCPQAEKVSLLSRSSDVLISREDLSVPTESAALEDTVFKCQSRGCVPVQCRTSTGFGVCDRVVTIHPTSSNLLMNVVSNMQVVTFYVTVRERGA
ncbi:hypothetical protein E6O75_ATG03828 [Venturia nashicola]|uniref:Uncharacterized protein n=1 Tax=Venturia nashicola TaxID=86259 RepID=A0A4Z1PBH4_9PEZI|nr:hypothetical protein E6O75_ATG03828 [Venturia nashicola]